MHRLSPGVVRAGAFLPVIPSVPEIEPVGPAATTNYLQGRRGERVALIVDHWTAASYEWALARFTTPTSDPMRVASAHYIVRTDGRISQVVAEEDTAYHAGVFAVNLVSIGIEHEASPMVPPSDALYESSSWLHARIAERYAMPLELGATVRGHREIVATTCPGTLDLARIIEGAEDDMFTQADRDMLARIKDLLEARESLVWDARIQRGLDVERGKPFDPERPPVDPRVEVK